ncbi:zinc finger and BTB domain-containing protein 17-like isoform X1 [Alosa sapidissima]|uniref:zinc finger and BTB domain-containing protein 17-like isoform X1 n=1 Tax=Alosa sapidissima TaxID=34773 RepID=UPI001C0A48F7|nr:zinc finger and BTB domain-containing protein 17-like isoform X1 [Alosa sapidissima]
MITRSESQFKGRISSILQVLVEAAVTEICELIDLEVATLRAELSVCRSEKGSARGKLQSTEENISFGNGREFGTADNNDTLPHDIAGREQAERKLFRNQGTPKTSQPCALWNQQSGSEDGKSAPIEGTELDAVSVKKEMLEDSEQSNKARDKQDADTSTVAMALPDPNEDMGSSLSPHTGLEWATSEASTHLSTKCGSKSEPVCDRSTHGVAAAGSRPSCMDCSHESEDDLHEWDSAVAEKHYAQSAQLAQDVDLQREQEEEEHGGSYLTHWTDPASPPRGPPQAHHSMQYLHEEPPDPMGGFGLNLPPGTSDFHNVRGDLSGSHLDMAVHHGADLEERYICPMCGKILRTDRALRAHMKDHTTLHICNHCGKSFARLTNLRVHQNIHMGLKPYTCKFCSKKFSDPSNYNRHKHRCPQSGHN